MLQIFRYRGIELGELNVKENQEYREIKQRECVNCKIVCLGDSRRLCPQVSNSQTRSRAAENKNFENQREISSDLDRYYFRVLCRN